LAGIPVIVLLSERMVRPIKKINQVTKQIAQLNFEETLPVYSSDELGTLAESVNIMSDKLKETMESLKKDIELRETLVRNMAHELKTPIAVIMGYAENMSYIAESHPEKLEQYCMVIVNESERMNGMIRQMLEVSAGTQGKMELNISEFSAEDFLEDIRRRYEDEFCTREGSYQSFNEITTKIHGDYQVLMQALYNYIKNAVRYGKKDGLIHVRAWEEEKYFSFAVFNQGDPVPEEEQEKIWNVFYKINPARTREEKSFGIGLSIVRQAAVAHGGKTGVKNVNDGVEFLLQIKK
jgi:signal transduction histidine kinase